MEHQESQNVVRFFFFMSLLYDKYFVNMQATAFTTESVDKKTSPPAINRRIVFIQSERQKNTWTLQPYNVLLSMYAYFVHFITSIFVKLLHDVIAIW